MVFARVGEAGHVLCPPFEIAASSSRRQPAPSNAAAKSNEVISTYQASFHRFGREIGYLGARIESVRDVPCGLDRVIFPAVQHNAVKQVQFSETKQGEQVQKA